MSTLQTVEIGKKNKRKRKRTTNTWVLKRRKQVQISNTKTNDYRTES